MEIWHLKDAAQIVLLVLTFGQRIYPVLVISLVKHPSPAFSFPSVQTEQRSPPCQKENISGESTKKRPILGLRTKPVAGGGLRDLAGATSSWWGFGGTLHGGLVANPVAFPLALDTSQATAPVRPPSAGDSFLPRICSRQSLSCQVGGDDVNPSLVGDCGRCWAGCSGSGVPKPFVELVRTWRLKAAQAGIGIGTTGRGNIHWDNRLFSSAFGSWTIAPGLGSGSCEDICIPILPVLTANSVRPQACENTILSTLQLPVSRGPLWSPILSKLIVQLHLWLG